MPSATGTVTFLGLLTIAQAGCGAWEFHQAGIPIDKVPPPAKCTANPNCPPNDGDCCPTPGKGGSTLDCCNTFACECKLHPQCEYENKTKGMCCPNDKGQYDPCCSNFRAAVNNPACEKAGVKGNACPDEKGKMHECCHADAKCSYKNQCPGLAGDCCPTPGGMKLGCCLNKDAEAAITEFTGTQAVQDVGIPFVAIGFLAVFVVGVAAGMRFTRPTETNEYVTLG